MDINNKADVAKLLKRPSTFEYLYVYAKKGAVLDFPGVRWVNDLEINAEKGAVVNFPDLLLVAGDLALRLSRDSTVRIPKLQEVNNFFDESEEYYDGLVEFSCIEMSAQTRTVVVPNTFLNGGRPYSYAENANLDRWFPIANDSSYLLSYNPAKDCVRAGCRYFTIDQGLKHWKEAEEYESQEEYDGYERPRANRARMFVLALSSLKASLQQA